MRSWLILIALCVCACAHAKRGVVEQAARAILAQQASDGAITMAKLGTAESTVIPYFGCFAAEGLLAVYAQDKDPKKLFAVRQWADWYAVHQNPDGTIYDFHGRAGAWHSTATFDSTDSYAAVYLDLLLDLHRVAPDASWFKARRRSIARAVAGIRLTMQPNGLTTAKPTYPVMYTMDNVETLKGLRAASELAGVLGDAAMARQTSVEAGKMQAAINALLWNEASACYRVAIQTDGGKMDALKDWYPDVMANLMAIAWLPPSERNRTLFARLRRQFAGMVPGEIKSIDDLEHLIWWAWAAKGAHDSVLLGDLLQRLAGFESVTQSGCDPADLGHVARLTALSR